MVPTNIVEKQCTCSVENGDIGVIGYAPTDDYGTALRGACMHGHLDIVKILLADERLQANDMPIMTAAINGHWDVVKFLAGIPKVVDPSVHQSFVLRHACLNGQYEIVKILLKDPRVDPSHDQGSALTNACENGHQRIVHKLLKLPKVNPTISEAGPLYYALLGGHPAAVNELILDRRVVQLFAECIPKYTHMIMDSLNALTDDKYVLAVNILIRSLFRALLPVINLRKLYFKLAPESLIARRLLMERELFTVLCPDGSYGEYIERCVLNDHLYHVVLLSRVLSAKQEAQLISRCVAEGHADIVEQLLLDGTDLMGWSWKLSDTLVPRRLQKLLDDHLRERLSEVTIGDQGNPIVLLALHQGGASLSPYIRYLPFINTPRPFTLLQTMRQHKTI